MLTIDGSEGEGGGQIIRSSLALSMITGKPFEIVNIRARRSKPGLARQHLTCVQAAAKVCDADVQGDSLKSQHIVFKPGNINPGDYTFQIGTAGSTTLVAQTVLPALLTCGSPSTVVVEGGTHNSKAPPFDFLQKAFVPVVNRMGPQVEIELQRYGFYPAGGGKISLTITPPEHWQGINLVDRGNPKPFVTAIVSDLPESIAERECKTICRKANWPAKSSEIISVENPRGPGNVVLISLNSGDVTEVFSGVGAIGVKAEHVARGVLRDARSYIAAGVPVGSHLADQLMLPCAIAAMNGQKSQYHTMALTQHSKTHVDIIGKFLDVEILAEELTEKTVCISIE